MNVVFNVLHLLGGLRLGRRHGVLVFVAVPQARMLEGAGRAKALRALGQRLAAVRLERDGRRRRHRHQARVATTARSTAPRRASTAMLAVKIAPSPR